MCRSFFCAHTSKQPNKITQLPTSEQPKILKKTTAEQHITEQITTKVPYTEKPIEYSTTEQTITKKRTTINPTPTTEKPIENFTTEHATTFQITSKTPFTEKPYTTEQPTTTSIKPHSCYTKLLYEICVDIFQKDDKSLCRKIFCTFPSTNSYYSIQSITTNQLTTKPPTTAQPTMREITTPQQTEYYSTKSIFCYNSQMYKECSEFFKKYMGSHLFCQNFIALNTLQQSLNLPNNQSHNNLLKAHILQNQ